MVWARGNYNNIIKTVIFWKPIGKRTQGRRPRKRRLDVIEAKSKMIGVNYWRNMIYDRRSYDGGKNSCTVDQARR